MRSVILSIGVASVAAAQPSYEIHDLTDVLDGAGYPIASAWSINNDNVITGSAFGGAFGYDAAVTWDAPDAATFLTMLDGDNASGSFSIEDDGAIVGLSNFVETIDCGPFIKIFEDQKAVIWSDGAPTRLADLVTGGATYIDLRIAFDRRADGAIVGHGRSMGEPPYTSYGFMLHDDGKVEDLGALTHPRAANDAGQIVGYNGDGQDKAYLWDNGALTNLHEGQGFSGVTSRAWAVSEDGVILGEAQFDISKPEEPAAWIDGKAARLAPEVNRPQGVATSVNASGVILGYYNDLDDLQTDWMSFRIDNGVRTDLFDLLVDLDGWTSLLALDINDEGWIVGYGVHDNQLGRAFVMIPICRADFNGDGVLSILDFVALQVAFNAGDESADVNGDGVLNVLDFVAFQELFLGGC